MSTKNTPGIRWKPSALLLLVLSSPIVQCSQQAEQRFDEVKYREEIEDWHSRRVNSLKSPTGWLNLAGLYWLKVGINTFGSDPVNDFVFPSGTVPARAGSFLLRNSSVTMELTPDVEVTLDSVPVRSAVIYYADSAYYPVLRHGSLQWFIIRRDNALGLRLRDIESKAVQEFKGIERFPVNPEWRLQARLEVPAVPRTLSITNIVGQTYQQASPGTAVFEVNGEEYRLNALDGGPEELYLIYGDATNGTLTYPSGRYLYIPRPDSTGRTVIDFNKAYNPPCAFTDFATCPLPPEQNVLPIEVRAGELEYHPESH